MEDDGGVLGRLPRSRPGTRSEKRATAKPKRTAAKATPKAAAAKATPKAAAAKPKRAPATPPPPRSQPMPERPPRRRPQHSVPPARERSGDPLTEVLRTGAKVAEGGVKLAGGLTRELLRRIPRP
jgi:hypothetical protein